VSEEQLSCPARTAGYATGACADLSRARFHGIITSGEYQWAGAYLAPRSGPSGDGRASASSIGLGGIPSVVDQNLSATAIIDIPDDSIDSASHYKTLPAQTAGNSRSSDSCTIKATGHDSMRAVGALSAWSSSSSAVTCCGEDV
jgi:hypothetical protein